MDDFLEPLAQLIVLDIFIGYGLYSIVLVILTLFIKTNDFINRLDKSANQIISFSGLLYSATLVILISLMPPTSFFERYGWVPWLQPVTWILITQFLWIKRVRQNKILRIIFSLLLIFSYERLVIIVTSFDRDYVPSGWVSALTPVEWIIGLTLKATLFAVVAVLYLYTSENIKRKVAEH